MKRLILLCGIGFLATVGFSQEVSSSRKEVVKLTENKEIVPVELLPDSVATVHSMSRNGKSVPVTQELESKPEKATPASSARKPD